MANRKKQVYKPKPMTEGKRNLIQGLLQEYDVVDFLNQHNTDLLACLWIDLYTVISLQKEKGPRAPTRKVVYSETMVKTMIIISDYTLILKEDSGVFC